MTARIREFLKKRTEDGPCLVVDLDVVRENYLGFAKALPDTRVYYAVKANPAPEILKLLVELGSAFGVASIPETEAVLAAGAEGEKSARAAPGARVICRIHCDGTGAEWPLSRKFGCEPEFAPDILELAHKLGLIAHGLSFHVGSQQHNVEAWDRALASAAAVFRSCAERGI